MQFPVDVGSRVWIKDWVKTPANLSDKGALTAALLERVELLVAQNAALMAENTLLISTET